MFAIGTNSGLYWHTVCCLCNKTKIFLTYISPCFARKTCWPYCIFNGAIYLYIIILWDLTWRVTNIYKIRRKDWARNKNWCWRSGKQWFLRVTVHLMNFGLSKRTNICVRVLNKVKNPKTNNHENLNTHMHNVTFNMHMCCNVI